MSEPTRAGEPTHAYMGRKPCGCVTAVIVNDPADSMVVAATVAKWIRTGRTAELTTIEDAQSQFKQCTCVTRRRRDSKS